MEKKLNEIIYELKKESKNKDALFFHLSQKRAYAKSIQYCASRIPEKT